MKERRVSALPDPLRSAVSKLRWFWSRASFRFPDGLPKELQGSSAPLNPWTFSSVVTEAQETCVD